jgi:hypothetical protein
VELLQHTAAPPGGSGQWNSCNALPHCLGAVGSGTPAITGRAGLGSGSGSGAPGPSPGKAVTGSAALSVLPRPPTAPLPVLALRARRGVPAWVQVSGVSPRCWVPLGALHCAHPVCTPLRPLVSPAPAPCIIRPNAVRPHGSSAHGPSFRLCQPKRNLNAPDKGQHDSARDSINSVEAWNSYGLPLEPTPTPRTLRAIRMLDSCCSRTVPQTS